MTPELLSTAIDHIAQANNLTRAERLEALQECDAQTLLEFMRAAGLLIADIADPVSTNNLLEPARCP
jgi:hypothetical protein